MCYSRDPLQEISIFFGGCKHIQGTYFNETCLPVSELPLAVWNHRYFEPWTCVIFLSNVNYLHLGLLKSAFFTDSQCYVINQICSCFTCIISILCCYWPQHIIGAKYVYVWVRTLTVRCWCILINTEQLFQYAVTFVHRKNTVSVCVDDFPVT